MPLYSYCKLFAFYVRNCDTRNMYKARLSKYNSEGVTLAQLVKGSVGQVDVQRFEPHLGHNWLNCGVFLVKSRHFGLPLTQKIRPNWQSLLAGGSVTIQTWSIPQTWVRVPMRVDVFFTSIKLLPIGGCPCNGLQQEQES